MTSRTYDRVGDGTFGHAVSGSVHSGELFTSRFVTGLSRTEQFRSNLGAVNTSAKEQSFRVLLRAVDGRVLAETAPLSLPAGGQMQWGLASLFPQAAGRGLTAEFRPAAGSSTPLAYAAVVDNLSGDPTFYPSLRPVPVLYLPGVARTSGVGDAFFASEVSISNASDAPTNVTVTFLERDRDNTASPAVSFLLGPRQTRFFEDFLWTLFGRTETYGALKIQGGPGSALLAAERISTASATTPGSVGQQVDPLTPDGFFARASLLGLREDAAFRSNVGVFNPNGYPVTVSLALRRGSGAALGAMNLRVPPYGYVQRNLRALFSGAGLPGGEMLTLSLDAGGAKVFAFAAVIDNVSQDPTFSPGLP
jgi:hypothetical protein